MYSRVTRVSLEHLAALSCFFYSLKSRRLLLVFGAALFVVIFQLFVSSHTDKQAASRLHGSARRPFLLTSADQHNDDNLLDQVVNTHCNVRDMHANITCLQALQRYADEQRETKLNSNDSCSECLTSIVNYHTFWQIDDSSSSDFHWRVMLLNIMSYLSTQNLCCTRFTLWKLATFPSSFERQLRRTFAHYIDSGVFLVRTFDMDEMCNDSVVWTSTFKDTELCMAVNRRLLTRGNLVSLSDLVRFVVLDAYGGIYVDGDVIFLADMRALWRRDFSYRWSYTNLINTAVLGLGEPHDLSQTRRILAKIVNKVSPLSFIRVIELLVATHFSGVNYLAQLFHPHTISAALTRDDTKTKETTAIFSNGIRFFFFKITLFCNKELSLFYF